LNPHPPVASAMHSGLLNRCMSVEGNDELRVID
jgi:hypothetical protein